MRFPFRSGRLDGHALGMTLLGLSVALTAACNQDDLVNSPGIQAAKGAETSGVPVEVEADDPSGGPAIGTVVGRSHLTRLRDGLRGQLHTTGLTPGDVVTMWIVVFQNPTGCINGCDNPAEDFGPSDAVLQTVGSAIVPRSGVVTITGKLNVGDEVLGPGAPFDTPMGSEVHLVIRTHGPVIRDQLELQRTTLNGGCPPNTCVSLQAGKHLP